MFKDEIEKLVAETLENVHSQNFERNDFFFDGKGPEKPKNMPDKVPGFIYYLQKKTSTFVIRILESDSLADDYKRILRYPEEYPSLRLLNEEDPRPLEKKLDFFECDSIGLAKAVKNQLANKRFPIHEEHIINVSDPGDNWWVKEDKGQLSIFFKLSRTESMEELVKIGPLGDPDHALSLFNQLYGYFAMLFPVKDYSSAHGQFTISCEKPFDPIFRDFMGIFTKGDIGHEFWEYLRHLEVRSQGRSYAKSLQQANYYLMEIALMRSFWMKIQGQLEG